MIELIYAFLLEAYEKNPVLYGAAVLAVMAAEGIILALLAEVAFRLLGIKVEKIGH